MAPGHRLLILSCSQRKRSDSGLLPAIERYDGPAFRVLRKFLRECPLEAQALDVYVLSAEFGLISTSQPIPAYDSRMTMERANELQAQVIAELERILARQRYEEMFISAGKEYMQALAGYAALVQSTVVSTASGRSQGGKLAALFDWLRGGPSARAHMQATAPPRGRAQIQGIMIDLTPEEVLEKARQALAEGRSAPTRYQAWYVLVDEQRVSPKWLISQLAGLPVSVFTTDQARRVLYELGIKVVRI